MPVPITITRATASHAEIAHTLIHEYYEAIGVIQRDTPAAIAAFLTDPASALWIAYSGTEPTGTEPVACVVLRPLPSIPDATECKRLYVRPTHRGQNIANLLLDAMEVHARANHTRWIYLDTKDDLKAAIHLYQRRGYTECPRYNDNPQATLFLRKDLSLP